MIASYKWLQDYVAIDVSPEELADRMVMTGNGVEHVEKLGAQMKKVVVGRIEVLEKHPDADKLQICQIDVGEGEPIQIVTGADNVFVGALVPVALCGSELPNGMKIKKGKLRGVASFGMLCSGEELCLKEEDYPGAGVYGILILQGDLKPGTDIKEVIGLDDTVIEFEVGANRPDCLSMIGIAREAAAALDVPVTLPEPSFTENDELISDYLRVEVEAADLCPRYMARAIKNVKIAPSPAWMQERLKAAGVRPINNIVDITNFVMLETGQPMHAFDAKDIHGGKIIVRRAKDGEKMTTLDGKERTFTSSMLLITDEEGPVAVAGIMGGENSEIKEDTKTVFFESAKFMYGNIRQSSRTLGLATESSMRYSKGVDTANVEFALHRACQLVEMLGAGEVVGGEIDRLAEDLSTRTVTVLAREINAILGTDLSAVEMKKCLDRVFLPTQLDSTKLTVEIPHFRGDIAGKADIAEEIARIYGYDNIPESRVTSSITSIKELPNDGVENILRYYIVASGYFESITYSFIGETDFDNLLLPKEDPMRRAVAILNPLGDDSQYMRTTLVPSMLGVMARNLNRKNDYLKMFEISKVHLPESLPLTDQLPEERRYLCMAISGEGLDFYSLKGDIENLADIMRIKGGFDFVAEGASFFHPGRKATIWIGDKKVGQMGEIHPDVRKNYDIPARVCLAELDLGALVVEMGTEISFQPLPKYPAIERDIAVLVDKHAPAGVIRHSIEQSGGKYLESVRLFDVFEGEQLGKGQKSLAYALTFRSPNGTLTDEMIAKDMKKILNVLNEKYGAQLRD